MPPTDPLPRFGDRITLRRLKLGDLSAFQAYRHDEEVGRYQGWSPQPDSESSAFLEQMARIPLFPPGGWVQLGIADRRTDELIGDIGICVAREVAEVGITLAARWQGRGLGSEALQATIRLIFEQSRVEMILAITDSRNTKTIRLLERAEMDRFSTHAALFRGETCVEHTYFFPRHRVE